MIVGGVVFKDMDVDAIRNRKSGCGLDGCLRIFQELCAEFTVLLSLGRNLSLNL